MSQLTSHMFAETTHVVTAPYGFACVVTAGRSNSKLCRIVSIAPGDINPSDAPLL